MTPHEILGVSPDATEAEIKRAYKKLAKQHHPDLNSGDKVAEAKFKEIAAAYESALKPEAEPLQPGFHPFDFSNFGNIFSMMGDPRFYQQNPDLTILCKMTLEMAFTGTKVKAQITGQDGKPREIAMMVPAGIHHGTRLRMIGAGNPATFGLPASDLYVQVLITPHDRFEQIPGSADLRVTVPMSVLDILLGGTHQLIGIDEQPVDWISNPSQTLDAPIRIPGAGMSILNESRRGDLLIQINPIVPALSEAQIELIRQAKALA